MKLLLSTAVVATFLMLPNAAFALTCTGTEPFWSLDIGKGAFTFSEAGGPAKTLETVAPISAANRSADLVRVYQTRVLAKGGKAMTIVVRAAENNSCSDGMSDNKYPLSAVIIRGQSVIEGCCRW
jgi:uncharacterized membrane protein